MIEESRRQRKIVGTLTSTFISLIPKCEKIDSYNDFMPISLYNLVYKLISKIITNRINPNISKGISKEQFGFSSNRQVLDVNGVSKECLHTVKLKKVDALILKMDLVKPYN